MGFMISGLRNINSSAISIRNMKLMSAYAHASPIEVASQWATAIDMKNTNITEKRKAPRATDAAVRKTVTFSAIVSRAKRMYSLAYSVACLRMRVYGCCESVICVYRLCQ